ncbi:MAG TPA: hypothetical protein VFE11_05690 [Dongiaceae bacterium]|nr:hypothetical protein [Dongiaceae bacterium]
MKAPAQLYFTVWDLAKQQLALAVVCRRGDHRATVQPMTLAAGGHGQNYPLSQAKARALMTKTELYPDRYLVVALPDPRQLEELRALAATDD